ncbi:uncharacterized protein LOC125944135 [Dermacentor silvarum]|uniref:uncharacterized protein LOC125944135 n=1 Tax=Dermacentor silvarum TaxID=543639 RepID=UPI002100B5D4|nr:uncharacterized protein LOC125944135 [Dermacentor silvarum]
MPPKRQFGKYLWDSSVEVPPRSKYRFKKRSFGADSAPVAMSEEDSSDGSDTEADDARCLAHAGSNQSTEPRCVEHCPSQSCDPSLSPCEDSSSSGSESEPDADLEPDHSERQCMVGWKDELDEDLFPGSKVTRAESLLMVMAHSLRHGTSKEATESLLQLLSAHLPEGVAYPTSKYTFFRHFSGAV